MPTERITVQYFRHLDVEVIRSFYSQTSYKNVGSTKASDEIVAAFEGDTMIGLYRICVENEVTVLRGFNVLPDYQRMGIGSLMLTRFQHEFRLRQCYLVCREGFNRFYSKANFAVCDDDAPLFLLERIASYTREDLNVLVRKPLINT